MTKIELIRRVTRNCPLDHFQVGLVLELLTNEMRGAVQRGEEVTIRGFGTLKPVVRKAKTGNLIKPGSRDTQPIAIPARTVVVFKPSDKFFEPTQPVVSPANGGTTSISHNIKLAGF